MGQNNLLYNLYLVNQAAHNDPALINKLLKTFVVSSLQNRSDLKRAFEAKDWEMMKSLAHKIKTNIDLLDITELKVGIRKIEIFDGKEYAYQELESLINEVFDGLQKVEILLKGEYGL
jgi:HPt (histidine-containing phosphotransfer) domain-containing protein